MHQDYVMAELSQTNKHLNKQTNKHTNNKQTNKQTNKAATSKRVFLYDQSNPKLSELAVIRNLTGLFT